MRRLLALWLAAAATAALAGPAAAKGPQLFEAGAVVICGPDRCAPFDDEGSLRWLNGLMYAEFPIPGPAPPLSPYYELRFTDRVGAEAPSIGWLVPGADAIRTPRLTGSSGWHWYPLIHGVPEAVAAAASGLEPYPAPALTGVYLGDREAADPAAYTGLLGPLEQAADPAVDGPRLPLGLVTADVTPWTARSSYAELQYAPNEDAVLVDAVWFQVPEGLAARIETDAGLRTAVAPAPVAAGQAVPWSLVASLAAAALVLAAGWLLRRRLRRPGDPAAPFARSGAVEQSGPPRPRELEGS